MVPDHGVPRGFLLVGFDAYLVGGQEQRLVRQQYNLLPAAEALQENGQFAAYPEIAHEVRDGRIADQDRVGP